MNVSPYLCMKVRTEWAGLCLCDVLFLISDKAGEPLTSRNMSLNPRLLTIVSSLE
jgi:hypothetical protein